MTIKEFRELRVSYRKEVRECLDSEYSYACIVGICRNIAFNDCYNNHERGQRFRAFFEALKDEGAFDRG